MSSSQARSRALETGSVDPIDCLPTYGVAGTQEHSQVLVEVVSPSHSSAGAKDLQLQRGEDDISVSDGEGDVEIEHLGSNFDPKLLSLSSNVQKDSQYTDVCRGKRTMISIWQKAILEEFYRSGMTSASMHIHSVHQLASEKTGLDIGVIKNWIRNRRRPGADKAAEKIANYISASNTSVNQSSSSAIVVPSVPQVPHIPSTMLPSQTIPHTVPYSSPMSAAVTISHTVPTVTSPAIPPAVTSTPNTMPTVHGSSPPTFRPDSPVSMTTPLAKKPRTEPSAGIKLPIISLLNATQSSALPPPPPHNLPPLAPHATHITASQTDSQILVKVRISGSGDEDFVEVEVPSLTYISLLGAICEELELSPSDVAKIRKLPNILVRKDKDVQRLREGQELEVIRSLSDSRSSEYSTRTPITSTWA